MNVYVVHRSEVWDGDESTEVYGVYRKKKDAYARLKQERDRVFPDWKDEKIIDDKEDIFLAYREGEYSLYHCEISIAEAELL